VDLASLIETIQLDHLAAHALDSYLRHAIAISLQSHAWFGTNPTECWAWFPVGRSTSEADSGEKGLSVELNEAPGRGNSEGVEFFGIEVLGTRGVKFSLML
jgi:hypothetical protein